MRSPFDPLAPTGTRTALQAPRLALASCVRGHVHRSTLGVGLDERQRLNHFPPTLLVTLSWLVQGEAVLVRRGPDAVHEPVPQVCVIGPHTVPCSSFNPGPALGYLVSFTPEAFARLTGVDVAALVNRIVPVRQVLGSDWRAMAQSVLAAPGDAQRVQTLEDFVEPRWRALAPQALSAARRYRDWTENLLLRAATTGVGSSLRQMERRVKQWAGLPARELRRVARGEECFYQVRDAFEAGGVQWAEAAVEGGYADQAHLCREVRRMTGLSPAALLQAVAEDEAYWPYRLRD